MWALWGRLWHLAARTSWEPRFESCLLKCTFALPGSMFPVSVPSPSFFGPQNLLVLVLRSARNVAKGWGHLLGGLPPSPAPSLSQESLSSPLFHTTPSSCSSGPGREPGLASLWLRPMRENRLKVQPLFSPGRKICSIRSVKRNLLSAPMLHNRTSPQFAIKKMPLALVPSSLTPPPPLHPPLPTPALSRKGQ